MKHQLVIPNKKAGSSAENSPSGEAENQALNQQENVTKYKEVAAESDKQEETKSVDMTQFFDKVKAGYNPQIDLTVVAEDLDQEED